MSMSDAVSQVLEHAFVETADLQHDRDGRSRNGAVPEEGIEHGPKCKGLRDQSEPLQVKVDRGWSRIDNGMGLMDISPDFSGLSAA